MLSPHWPSKCQDKREVSEVHKIKRGVWMTLGASTASHCVFWLPRSPQPSPSPGDQGEAKNWTHQLTTLLAADSKSFLGGRSATHLRVCCILLLNKYLLSARLWGCSMRPDSAPETFRSLCTNLSMYPDILYQGQGDHLPRSEAYLQLSTQEV